MPLNLGFSVFLLTFVQIFLIRRKRNVIFVRQRQLRHAASATLAAIISEFPGWTTYSYTMSDYIPCWGLYSHITSHYITPYYHFFHLYFRREHPFQYCVLNPEVPGQSDVWPDFRLPRPTVALLSNIPFNHGWGRVPEAPVFLFWLVSGTSYHAVSGASLTI